MTVRLAVDKLIVGYDARAPNGAAMTFSVGGGESLAVQGRSGSGKTSLLLTLNGLLPPVAGRVVVGDTDLWSLGDGARARIRREQMGYVFQFGEMLPELSVQENVALPLLLLGRPEAEANASAGELLAPLGVAHLARRDIREISGGELQRVAVARALVHRPRVVLADEPTGALDSETAGVVMQLLLAACREAEAVLVIVTHDRSVATMADAVVHLGRDVVVRS